MEENTSDAKLQRPVYKKILVDQALGKINKAVYFERHVDGKLKAAGFRLPRKERRRLARMLVKKELTAWRANNPNVAS